MKKLRLAAEELYPVYITTDQDAYLDVPERELPDWLADRFINAETEFFAAQRELTAYFAAIHRDEHADDRFRTVNKARIERGRRKHHRRPRPASR